MATRTQQPPTITSALAGFDLADPVAAAATFGLTPSTLEKLTSLLLAQAAAAVGEDARRLTALIGLHRFAEGLPEDWPTLAAPADPGRLLSDPLAAARDWLQRLASGASAAGESHLDLWIEQLRSVLGGSINADALAGLGLSGAGTYDEPWTLPFPGSGSVGSAQLHLWLDPDGPPSSLAGGIATLIGGAVRFPDLLQELRKLGHYEAALRSSLRGRTDQAMSDGFE